MLVFFTFILDYCSSLFFWPHWLSIKAFATHSECHSLASYHVKVWPTSRHHISSMWMHWLRVKLEIEFNFFCIDSKTIQQGQTMSQYPMELISIHISNIHTKSYDGVKLACFVDHLSLCSKVHSDCTSSIFAPNIWNWLRVSLKRNMEYSIFENALKHTYRI